MPLLCSTAPGVVVWARRGALQFTPFYKFDRGQDVLWARIHGNISYVAQWIQFPLSPCLPACISDQRAPTRALWNGGSGGHNPRTQYKRIRGGVENRLYIFEGQRICGGQKKGCTSSSSSLCGREYIIIIILLSS